MQAYDMFTSSQNSELRTQKMIYLIQILHFVSPLTHIKLVNSFGLGEHLLRQDIVAGTDAQPRIF